MNAEEIVKVIVNAPKYLIEYTVGLIAAVVSQIDLTTDALLGVAVGFAVGSVWWGLVAFFVVYSFGRAYGHIADAIAKGLYDHANGVGNAIVYAAQPPQAENPETDVEAIG